MNDLNNLNNRILLHIPGIELDEMNMLKGRMESMPSDKYEMFLSVYKSKRKDPQLILIMALIGLLGIGGIHRFFLNHIGMGILYLLTAGLCYIGTIVDLVNYKSIALEYNQGQILETARMVG